MRSLLVLFLLVSFLATSCKQTVETETKPIVEEAPIPVKEENKAPEYPIIVLHGGAGTVTKERLQNGLEEKYTNALDSAISIGFSLLDSGASAVLAVERTINFLENSPLFNSGKGAVLNAEGNAELDASIMDGSNLMAGAVAGVSTVQNPISLARMVKDSTKHVLLSGKGAEAFAVAMNVEPIEMEYFITPKTRARREERLQRMDKLGTVGCVAIDKNGNIAAGTSTGGMDNKKFGRIGDSPIIGAGTYANNNTCGVSCTGHGEYFIKNAVAYDMSALFEYEGVGASEAAEYIINDKLKSQNAAGGLIAIDKNGQIGISFNTPGMFWASQRAGEEAKVGMYKTDEKPH
ncbi:MAG: isoaspartyl peptidase/L-asparaginase [Bacteroidia bacterium]